MNKYIFSLLVVFFVLIIISIVYFQVFDGLVRAIIFVGMPLIVLILLFLYMMKGLKQKRKKNISSNNETENQKIAMKKMLESIDYKNGSMEFDIDIDNINDLKAAKTILEDLMKSNLNVFDTKDIQEMLEKINELIKRD
ncbi:MAG: hypothetical protein FWG98_10775 [Candidatus Cloacimonetes bacterium]|nr:hypothetical protein [Candidatus Cloacimonadota bacterium]